jgi:hypothetical protein
MVYNEFKVFNGLTNDEQGASAADIEFIFCMRRKTEVSAFVHKIITQIFAQVVAILHNV